MFLLNVCLAVFSQIRIERSKENQDAIFSMGQGRIVVDLRKIKHDNSSDYFSILNVSCTIYCIDDHTLRNKDRLIPRFKNEDRLISRFKNKNTFFTRFDRIFQSSTYDYFYLTTKIINEKTVESMFQDLYDWIIEIEDFALKRDILYSPYKMKYCDITARGPERKYYLVKAIHSNIKIYTSNFQADMAGYDCDRWAYMNLEDITEFKSRLLEYIQTHNINLKL